MRIAAGILLIIGGVSLMVLYVPMLITPPDIPSYAVQNLLLFIIPGVFVVTGGVFCLKRKYWKLCFVSALLAVLMMIYCFYEMTDGFSFPPYDVLVQHFLILIPTGVLPLILVCIRKREWQEISA